MFNCFPCRTIEVDNTDEDEMEETGNNGYEPIPTSAEGPDDNEEQEDDEIEFGYTTFDGEEFQVRTARDYHQLLDETTPRTTMDEAAAATTRPSAESIPLDPTQIENIKSIMSNITLPTEGIPNWANTVSDDQLKQVVENKLGNKKPEDDWAVFE